MRLKFGRKTWKNGIHEGRGGGGGEEIERIKVKQKKYKEAYTSVLPGVKKKQAAGVREYQSTSPEKKSNLLFMATWKQ